MEVNPLVNMTMEERLDTFLLDTFQTHTRHDRTMEFGEIWDCYEAWCEAMNVPVIGGKLHLGAALKKRFFSIRPQNRKKWFVEIRDDVKGLEEELNDEYRDRDFGDT